MDSRELVGESAAGLAETLPDGGALIGLDLGTKTIGIAVCDAGWRFASALKTLPRGKFGRDRDELRKMIEARSVRGIVIGLPRNMDGTEGPRCQKTRAFARNLSLFTGALADAVDCAFDLSCARSDRGQAVGDCHA
mgnify:CR=1 FL=1